ncbi:MAG: hypothetical protein NDI77_01930 [Geobacteraceae bacterium]|nr:hypothetical protein [Geobacteraceae bacterium]
MQKLQCLYCALSIGKYFPARFLIFTTLLLTLHAGESSAKQRTLLQLGGLRQQISLDYTYDGAVSESNEVTTSASQQRFDENYAMGLRYAIYDPRLLTGSFSGTAGLTQSQELEGQALGGTDSGQNFQYRLTGMLLQRESTPVTFYSYSQLNRVQRPFSSSYDLTTDGFGVAMSIHNAQVPSTISYSRSSAATSGQGIDTNSTGDSLSLSASHSYRNLVSTSASFSRSSSETDSGGNAEATSSDAYQVGLTNNLNIDNARGRALLTKYQLRNTAGTRSTRSSEWTENLSWGFGKALYGGLNYVNSYENSGDQKATANSGGAFLQHRLFASLSTSLNGHVSHSDFSSGSVSSVGGGISLDYQKTLPRESLLQLTASQSLSVSENELREDVLFVTNERHTVPDLVTVFEFELVKSDIIHDVPGDIVVMNRDRTFTYTEGTDYTIRQDGRLTFVVFPLTPAPGPFPITAGVELTIDYRYRVDPSIKYSTSSRAVSANLSLFSSRHRIYASYADSDQEAISQQQDASRLNESRLYTVGYTARLEYSSFAVAYRRQESTTSDSDNLSASWRFARNFGNNYLSVSLRDNYSLYGKSGVDGNGDFSNAFSLDSVYQKVLYGRINMRLNGQYVNIMGRTESDTVALGLDLSTWFGRSELVLQSSVDWRFSGTTAERHDNVKLTYRRHF